MLFKKKRKSQDLLYMMNVKSDTLFLSIKFGQCQQPEWQESVDMKQIQCLYLCCLIRKAI